MVWIFSVLGVCLMFTCSFFNYRQENNTDSFKSYLKDKSFREITIELIVVILGVTLAINFSEILDKRETNARMKELLELGCAEVIASYNANEILLKSYKEKSTSVAEIKYNAQDKTKTLENILNNENVMVSLTPVTYVGLCNHIDLVDHFYSILQEAPEDDKEIATYVAAMDSSFEAIIFLVTNEIAHLEGKQTEKETLQNYTTYYNEKYIEIE